VDRPEPAPFHTFETPPIVKLRRGPAALGLTVASHGLHRVAYANQMERRVRICACPLWHNRSAVHYER
jgi:hypothetical protein